MLIIIKDTDKENDEEKKKDETRVYLELEKDISKTKLNKKKEVIRQPSTIYIHYAESIGSLLINFLNADFSSFESAYNTFFYAYGFELIKEYTPYIYSKTDECITDVELLYRRTYQQKVMTVYRNKENKQLKKDFDKWKKEAQDKIKLFKKGKLDEDTLYNWMLKNK